MLSALEIVFRAEPSTPGTLERFGRDLTDSRVSNLDDVEPARKQLDRR